MGTRIPPPVIQSKRSRMIRSEGLDHPTDHHKLSVANLILKYELEICVSGSIPQLHSSFLWTRNQVPVMNMLLDRSVVGS